MKNNIRINVIVNIIRTLVLTLLSFITFPWVCRYLKDSAVGLYTWANTFVAYFLILAKIGIPNLAVRECVKVRDDKEKLSNVAQTFFILQLVATLVSFSLLLILVNTIPALKNSSAYIYLLSINFLSGVFSFEWIFIALEKQFYMSTRSIIALTLAAILTVIFVTNPSDVYIYCLITVSVTIVTTIINLMMVNKYISFKKTMPYNFSQFAKPLFILCTLSLSLSLYNQTDTFILGLINNDKTLVASYSVGIKGIDIIIGIITSLSTVFIPRAAFYYGKEDKRFFNNLNKYSINICLFIVLPAIVTMCVLSKEICSLISGTFDYSSSTNGFIEAPTILMILASMMLTYSLGDIIYGQILLPTKKEKYYLITIILGTLINGGLSVLLGYVLPRYVSFITPTIGVAIGTMFTDLLIIIILLSLTWKWTKKAIFNANTIKLLIANGILLLISLLLHYPLNYLFSSFINSLALVCLLNMITLVIIDASVYLIVLILLKEDLVYSFIRNHKEAKNNI